MSGVVLQLIQWGPVVVLAIASWALAFAIGRRTGTGLIFHVRPPDARGWVGIASFLLVLLCLGMIWADRTLLRDDFFKVIATALIISAWNQGPVGWAFQATKAGGELAERNAALVEKQASQPQDVTIVNPDTDPVPVEATGNSDPTRKDP